MQRSRKLLRVGALALVGLLSATTAYAQTSTTGAVQGFVSDEETGAPMLLVNRRGGVLLPARPAVRIHGRFRQYFLSTSHRDLSLVFIYGEPRSAGEHHGLPG